jgi:hypothetical protein
MASKHDYRHLIDKKVRSTIPMAYMLLAALAYTEGREYEPEAAGMEGYIREPFDCREDYLIVRFSDGTWAEYKPEAFEVIES